MLPVKQLLPEKAIKYCQFQKDKEYLTKSLNNIYKPVCFKTFNINPYPLLFNKKLIDQINDCHSLLIEAIHQIVSNFFNDPILQQTITLDGSVHNLLRSLKKEPYKIGAIRPDFLFDKKHQIKVCEINARFPLNAFIISHCIHTELGKQVVYSHYNKKLFNNFEILQQFFSCKQPIYIFFKKEKSFDLFLLQNILKKTVPKLNLKLFNPFKFLLNNFKSKQGFRAILNLHQSELLKLEPNLLNKIITQSYFNDIRTIFIVHDKRILSILSDKAIMSKYLSLEKCNRLAAYIIPTYKLNDSTIQSIKNNPKEWVLKKITSGKGDGMYIGNKNQYSEILTLLNKEKLNYVAQPFIKQAAFQPNASFINKKNQDAVNFSPLNLVGCILSFNDLLLGPGVIRGSHKKIINVAQGNATIFMPIY